MPLAPYQFVYAPETTIEEATITAALLEYGLDARPDPALVRQHVYTVAGWPTVWTTSN